MSRVVGILVVLAVLVAACGSDVVDSAENCAELAEAWRDGDQADQQFRDQVEARAADLEDSALGRGADAEAVACKLLGSQAGADPVEEFFMEG